MERIYLAALLVLLAALVAGIFAGWQGRKFVDRIEHLEKLSHTRLPYGAADGIEDVNAILNDIRFQGGDLDQLLKTLLKSEVVRAYTDTRLADAIKILHAIRNDPHSYDSDALNQKKQVL